MLLDFFACRLYRRISFQKCVCRSDHYQQYLLGDLNKDSFVHIWNSESWQKLRQEHVSFKSNSICSCSKCDRCYDNRLVDFENMLFPHAYKTILSPGKQRPSESFSIISGEVKKKKVSKIIVGITCVQYSDLLKLTLPSILRLFPDATVITNNNDAETYKVVKTHKAKLFQTNAFYRNGYTFGKAAALNDWLRYIDIQHSDRSSCC